MQVCACMLSDFLSNSFLFLLYCYIKGLSKLYERQHLSSACVSVAELTSIFMPTTKCGIPHFISYLLVTPNQLLTTNIESATLSKHI